MLGQDSTQVLPNEADEVIELTEEIREPFKQMSESEKEALFYSCLRDYTRWTEQVRDRRKG